MSGGVSVSVGVGVGVLRGLLHLVLLSILEIMTTVLKFQRFRTQKLRQNKMRLKTFNNTQARVEMRPHTPDFVEVKVMSQLPRSLLRGRLVLETLDDERRDVEETIHTILKAGLGA